MSKKHNILLASRAIESQPREGGFVLLSDIAKSITKNSMFKPSVFSCTKQKSLEISKLKVFSSPGWSTRKKIEFMFGLFLKAHLFDIVHTAHIPTKQNVLLVKLATVRARRKGVKFVQTVTGLPNPNCMTRELSKLLWGDYIVCQSRSIYEKVQKLNMPASLITPVVPESRVSADKQRRQKIRKLLFKDYKTVIVFPGEFDRLGVDISFRACLEEFINNTTNSLVVFACRFDKYGTGEKLARIFPGRVLSLGNTSNILQILEAADLVIYPVRKMNSKFQPPLVLIESLQLGTPVLASDIISIDESFSSQLSFVDTSLGWQHFGQKMVSTVKKNISRPGTDNRYFKRMVSDYLKVYVKVAKIS